MEQAAAWPVLQSNLLVNPHLELPLLVDWIGCQLLVFGCEYLHSTTLRILGVSLHCKHLS